MDRNFPERIYLVGFMGCGKTTAGKKLAQLLHYTFIDIDSLIEQQEGCTIAELFSGKGESYFRELEKETIHQTFNTEKVVIATGGGAPTFFDTMEQMNQQGITIYLELSPKALFDRLIRSKNQRPLLKDKNQEELLIYITQTLQKREPFYRQSKLIIDGIGVTAQYLKNALDLYKNHRS